MKRIAFLLSGAAVALLGTSQADETKVDFNKDIQPILERSCISCHGPKKVKGKLRLDTKELAFKERDMPAIVPGKADESELLHRISLPAGDDDIMPADGDPLTKEQIEVVRNWILQGAVWPDGVVLGKDAATIAAEALPEAPKATPDETKALQSLEDLGVAARPIAMNVGWREANFYLLGTNVTDESLKPLKDIATLMHLNLANTAITDAGLGQVKGLVNLRRLHLEKTGITDAGLAHLKGLVNLNYLNLYGTGVSDAGLKHLEGLRNLKSLYLWQTQVTDEGVAALKKALPELEIVRGWDLTAEVKKEGDESADDKKEEKKD
ncbi:MAG: hypothetical protein K9N62_19480 [Verrucomicrobia bacterium]|nr:hypothetical protein [Verrucomicrobiota bacterium]